MHAGPLERLRSSRYARKRCSDIDLGNDHLKSELDRFLLNSAKKACYAWKTEQAKRVYTLLAARRPKVRGQCGEVVLEKCLQDFLSELKRLHVCMSSRLSRDKKEDQTLIQCRRLLSSLISGLERRIQQSRCLRVKSEEQEGEKMKKITTTMTIEELRLRCPRFAQERSWRHLCEHRCFYREHEPARKMKELKDCWEFHQLLLQRKKTKENNKETPASVKVKMDMDWSQWYTKLEVCMKSEGQFRVVFVSPEGRVFRTVKQVMQHLGLCIDKHYRVVSLYEERSKGLVAAEKKEGEEEAEAEGGLPRQAASLPTCGERERKMQKGSHDHRLDDADANVVLSLESPYGLIEELFADHPWKLLVCCLLLNLTTRKQLDPVLYHFFETFPTPESLLGCENNQNKILRIIAPLGLQSRRTQTLLRFSKEFLEWRRLKQKQLPFAEPKENKEEEQMSLEKSRSVRDLHGVGRYAQQAYDIFCLRKVKGTKQQAAVEDHALNWYLDWALEPSEQHTTHNTP